MYHNYPIRLCSDMYPIVARSYDLNSFYFLKTNEVK